MSDRNESKQRRAAQNKAAREALASRKTRAAQGPATRGTTGSAGATSGTVAVTGRTRGRIKGPVGEAGRPARTAPVRQARPARNPITRFLADLQAQPGGKAVFYAVLFSAVAAVLILTTKAASEVTMTVPFALIKAFRAKNHLPVPKGVKTSDLANNYALAVLNPIQGVVVALAPLVITGSTAMLVRQGVKIRRNITTGVVALMIVFILGESVLTLMIFPVGAMIFAMYQARKADPPPIRQRKPRAGPTDQDDGGGEGDDDEYDQDDGEYEDDEEYQDDEVDHEA